MTLKESKHSPFFFFFFFPSQPTLNTHLNQESTCDIQSLSISYPHLENLVVVYILFLSTTFEK